jgi:hypothetical protein
VVASCSSRTPLRGSAARSRAGRRSASRASATRTRSTPTGADKVLLKAGLAGKAKAQFKAKGDNIPSFSLPLSLPVTAQIQSENGECWAATFSLPSASKNDASQFKGKSD